MLVSFITPTYNDDAEHLAKCVASVRSQNHAQVEHIVVDDGSDEPVVGGGVTLIRQANAGPAAARNAGAAAAKGDILVFLDADDHVSPMHAAEAVHVLADPDATIAYPRVQEFGERSRLDDRSDDRGVTEFISSSGVPIGSACRRVDFDAAGRFDEALRGGYEDTEFWLRLMLTRPGVARRMPGATLHYRIRPGSRASMITSHAATTLTRERAIANATALGQAESLAMALWSAVDREVEKRRAVTGDRLYLRPHAARLKRAIRRLR